MQQVRCTIMQQVRCTIMQRVRCTTMQQECPALCAQELYFLVKMFSFRGREDRTRLTARTDIRSAKRLYKPHWVRRVLHP